jgi:hypothetical protein
MAPKWVNDTNGTKNVYIGRKTSHIAAQAASTIVNCPLSIVNFLGFATLSIKKPGNAGFYKKEIINLHLVFDAFGRFEHNLAAGRDLDLLACLGVAAHLFLGGPYFKGAEAKKANSLAVQN